MMEPVTSNLIAASAGTGKTYKLASRYISLLALGYPAERLIALTFTRNAAGEFKSRILSDLAEGAASEEGAAKLTARIRSTLKSSDEGAVSLCPQVADSLELNRAVYLRLLRDMIAKLPRLSLSTMDSFFTKLIGAHRFELGFPSIEFMDNAELAYMRRKAVQSILVEADEQYDDALIELCQDLTDDSKRDVLTVLEKNVSDFYVIYRDTKKNVNEVWGNCAEFGFDDARVQKKINEYLTLNTDELHAALRSFLDEQEENINRLAAQAEKVAGKLGGALNDACGNNNNEPRSKGGVISKLKKYLGYEKGVKKDASIGKRLGRYMYAGEGANWPEVERLMAELRYTRDVVVWLMAIRKTRGVARLLRVYDELYTMSVRATGKLVFNDMPRLVSERLMNVSNKDSIAYRLDGQLDHWMLDEFQDTSPEQWAALSPLLEEIHDAVLSDPAEEQKRAQRSIFVVGDEKQSIYAWRGATPELFTYLKTAEDWRKVLQVSPMNESYRSAAAIMGDRKMVNGLHPGFVNELFAGIFRNDEKKRKEFTQHQVAEALQDKPGYVRVEGCMANKDLNMDVLTVMCQAMSRTLCNIGYKPGKMTVAILARSNNSVRRICRWFRDNCPEFPVMSLSDEEVGGASLLGQMFMHFFKWLQHPGDKFREHLLTCHPFQICRGESIEKAWVKWRKKLEYSGYVAVVDAIASGMVHNVMDDRAYREWINAARSFDASGGTLDQWVRYIEDLINKVNPPKSYIHVMTIHKSKGAQYDVVLLPFNGAKAVNESRALLSKVDKSDGNAEVKAIVLNPRVTDDEVPQSPYNRMTMEWKQAALAEALNVLYVAVSRAKHANYIFLNRNAEKKNKPHELSFPGIIAGSIGVDREWGDPEWYLSDKMKYTPQLEEVGYAPRLAPPHDRVLLVKPSAIRDESETEHHAGVAPLGVVEREAVRSFGTAVHGLFEQVEWLNAVLPCWVAEPRSAEEKLVSAALQQEDIRTLFTRQPGQVVYNEQNIDAVEGDKWISGTLDRLVLTHDASGKVAEAHIIDFKTDIRCGESPVEQDAHLCRIHSAQMKLYRELIAAAFELPVEAVRVTLISCPREGSPARAVPWPARA